MTITLPEGTVKYTSIIKGRIFPGDDKETHGLGVMYPKDSGALDDLRVAIKNLIDEKFEKMSDKKKATMLDTVIKDCDEMEKYEEDESTNGMYLINLRVFDGPLFPFRNDELRTAITEEDSKEFFPGCLCMPVVDLWARAGQKHAQNPGVTLVLKAVLKTGEGDRIGSVFNARAAFEGVAPKAFSPSKELNAAVEGLL